MVIIYTYKSKKTLLEVFNANVGSYRHFVVSYYKNESFLTYKSDNVEEVRDYINKIGEVAGSVLLIYSNVEHPAPVYLAKDAIMIIDWHHDKIKKFKEFRKKLPDKWLTNKTYVELVHKFFNSKPIVLMIKHHVKLWAEKDEGYWKADGVFYSDDVKKPDNVIALSKPSDVNTYAVCVKCQRADNTVYHRTRMIGGINRTNLLCYRCWVG